MVSRLIKNEYNTIMTWLDNGAIDDTPKDTINDFEKAK